MDATTRQAVAVHARGRSEYDVKVFWAEVPEPYRSSFDAYMDKWDAYRGAIPPGVHFAVKKSGKTSLIEGVNCILRQRISRLARKLVAFSKSFVNHMGAMRSFLYFYNRRAYDELWHRLDIYRPLLYRPILL